MKVGRKLVKDMKVAELKEALESRLDGSEIPDKWPRKAELIKLLQRTVRRDAKKKKAKKASQEEQPAGGRDGDERRAGAGAGGAGRAEPLADGRHDGHGCGGDAGHRRGAEHFHDVQPARAERHLAEAESTEHEGDQRRQDCLQHGAAPDKPDQAGQDQLADELHDLPVPVGRVVIG